MPSIELLQAVAVTAELCGRTFSEAAAREASVSARVASAQRCARIQQLAVSG